MRQSRIPPEPELQRAEGSEASRPVVEVVPRGPAMAAMEPLCRPAKEESATEGAEDAEALAAGDRWSTAE